MATDDARDISRFTILDVMLFCGAVAMAAFFYSQSKVASLNSRFLDTYLAVVLAISATLSFCFMMLHHMLTGDRPSFGFFGGVALAFSLGIFSTLLACIFVPTFTWLLLPISMIALSLILCSLLLWPIVVLLFPKLRKRLTWLDYYGLAAVLLGGFGIYSILRQVGDL